MDDSTTGLIGEEKAHFEEELWQENVSDF